MQATLPENLESVGLKDILENQSVYTVPWAMYADNNRMLWLNGNYTFGDQPHGTQQMRVIKMNGEYICDVSRCKDHSWSCGGNQFMGNFVSLPVARLICNSTEKEE